MNSMKMILLGIFAHPDDEAFGPSGTLLKMTRAGYDVHLICATRGENGVNLDNCRDLGNVRLQEWQQAGALIGVTSQHNLGYEDGTLCNNLFHDIATSLEKRIDKILNAYKGKELEVSFMTFDQNGISGHIDHVTMSMITSYIYYQYKGKDVTSIHYKELRYFCNSQEDCPTPDTGYVFMPPGREAGRIDIIEDISEVGQEKKAVMLAHRSQRQDAEMLLRRTSTLQREYFYLG
jgi:N-acetylglucosamine malate deacetylase 2